MQGIVTSWSFYYFQFLVGGRCTDFMRPVLQMSLGASLSDPAAAGGGAASPSQETAFGGGGVRLFVCLFFLL